MANYGYKGWIKLWRKEMKSQFYFDEPFTKWQAYIDLCLLANDKGIVETSLKALQNRWSWTSIKKVRAFMGIISELELGTVKGIRYKGIEIHINQGVKDSEKSEKGTEKGTEKGIVSTDKEVTSKEVRATKCRSNSTSDSTEDIDSDDLSWMMEDSFDD